MEYVAFPKNVALPFLGHCLYKMLLFVFTNGAYLDTTFTPLLTSIFHNSSLPHISFTNSG
jgi:hypothetical protein